MPPQRRVLALYFQAVLGSLKLKHVLLMPLGIWSLSLSSKRRCEKDSDNSLKNLFG